MSGINSTRHPAKYAIEKSARKTKVFSDMPSLFFNCSKVFVFIKPVYIPPYGMSSTAITGIRLCRVMLQ
jgi:hypothetical protein